MLAGRPPRIAGTPLAVEFSNLSLALSRTGLVLVLDTAERDHRSVGGAKNKVRDGVFGQRVDWRPTADVCGWLGVRIHRSEAFTISKAKLGHARPPLGRRPLSNSLAAMMHRVSMPLAKGPDKLSYSTSLRFFPVPPIPSGEAV